MAIGLLRWGLCLRRETIQALLIDREIHISTGEISYLSLEFLILFKLLHKQNYPMMKKLFNYNQGSVLHVDGTQEQGSKVVFSLKEGLTDITLMAELIPAENEKHLKPLFQEYKEHFGEPLVIVRDMSEAVKKSAAAVFPTTPQQVCHVHFLRNLGKKITSDLHESLRQKILKKKINPMLNTLRKEIRGKLNIGVSVKGIELWWTHVAIDYVLHPLKQKYNPPFCYPYLEMMKRGLETSSLTKRIIRWNAENNLYLREVIDLNTHLKLKEDRELIQEFQTLERVDNWFDKIREVLRLSREDTQITQPLNEDEKKKIEAKLALTLEQISSEGEEDKVISKRASAILNAFEEHRDELFVTVSGEQGKKIAFNRENNIEERGHRWCRRMIRKRTGRERTSREMEEIGPLLALFSNISSEAYQENILNKINDLVEEFSKIPYEDLMKERKQLTSIRKAPALPVKDKERAEKLKKFVELLENSPNYPTADMKAWLDTLE